MTDGWRDEVPQSRWMSGIEKGTMMDEAVQRSENEEIKRGNVNLGNLPINQPAIATSSQALLYKLDLPLPLPLLLQDQPSFQSSHSRSMYSTTYYQDPYQDQSYHEQQAPPLISVDELPSSLARVFARYTSFNAVQSAALPLVLHSVYHRQKSLIPG